MKIRGTTITTPIARDAVADDACVSKKPWSSKNTVDKLCPAFEESGTVVQCDPVEGYPLEVLTQIEPVQSGSGDPCPPGGGRNLWQVDTNTVISAYIDATSIAAYSGYSYVVYIPCEPNTTYTVSKFKGKRFSVAYCTELPAVGVPIYGYVTDGTATSITITTGGDAKYLAAYVYFGGTDDTITTWNAAKHTIQIEKGDTATEYQPYSNIRPITGHTDVKLYHSGKNLAPNVSRTLNKTGITIEFIDNILKINGTGGRDLGGYSADYAFTLPAGTYTWSLKKVSGTCTYSGSSGTFYLRTSTGYVSVKDMYGAVNRDGTFTLTEPTNLCLDITTAGSSTYKNLTFTFQVEAGSTATAFEPYNEGSNTFTMELGQTVYGGSLDWKTGVLTVDKVCVAFNGTESWEFNKDKGEGKGCRYDYNYTSQLIPKGDTCICSHYPHVAPEEGMGVWTNGGYSTTTVGLRILWTYKTVAELKAYLTEQYAAGTPVQICYPLVTPITVQLTPQEVMALSGMNCLISDTGNTTVSGKADPNAVIQDLYSKLNALSATMAALTGV